MSKTIRVGVKHPNQPILFKNIPNTLRAFQEEVQGSIEILHYASGLPHYKGMDVFVNEDGLSLDLPAQLMPWGTNPATNHATLAIKGPILFVRRANKAGNHVASLTKAAEAALSKLFKS